MIFVDASAMVAMMAGEPPADELADRLAADRVRLVSAISIWETTAALCRSYTFAVPDARQRVQDFISLNNLDYVGLGQREADMALRAYADYGRGRHPAALNMGDCFAYACAKNNRAALLYIGSDFAKTDIISAL